MSRTLTLEFVKVRVVHVEVCSGFVARTLVNIHAHDCLQDLDHLVLGLVPQRAAQIDLGRSLELSAVAVYFDY